MRDYITSWPKLIGGAVAGLGLFALLGFAPVVHIYFHALDPSDFAYPSVGVLFLILSYPLARGHEWARRVLLVTTILIGTYCFLRGSSSLVRPHNFSGGGDFSAPWPAVENFIVELGRSLLLLTLALFAVGVLCQRDVVSAFRKP